MAASYFYTIHHEIMNVNRLTDKKQIAIIKNVRKFAVQLDQALQAKGKERKYTYGLLHFYVYL